MMWMENGKNKLLSKSRGTSIMVSGFCCGCHGFFTGGTNQSKPVKVGKDGILRNVHLVEHFETQVVDLINNLLIRL